MTNTPSVFISYSHDSRDHKRWVLRLAEDLRVKGINTLLDQWDLVPGQDLAAFMQRGILDSDRVLLICTREYVEKAEKGSGGVGFERLIVTGEVIQNIDTHKFIPIVRSKDEGPTIPRFLGPRLYINFSNDAEYEEKLEELARALHGTPLSRKPPVGANPFSGEVSQTSGSPRLVSANGIVRSGAQLLNEPWFQKENATSESGLKKLGLKGSMELRFGLHSEVAKSQVELLNAVKRSEIRTFGWPIGITLESDDNLRPRPHSDGIKAEVSIEKDSLLGRPSYDYWAAKVNGDFYLLQSLFEDSRGENLIYFNTRIIRVTEALMFASNYYNQLGASPNSMISFRVTHSGLKGRTLTAVGNRHVFPRLCHEAISTSEINIELKSINENITDHVRKLVEPLFILFEFQEFNESVYKDIVTRFVNGEAT